MKMKINSEHIKGVLARAELLHPAERVEQAASAMVEAIGARLGDQDPLVLCVMNGAVVPAALLLMRMSFPLRLDHLHATRYQGATRGGELEWLSRPRWPLRDEHILVVDDIFDAGTTLELIVRSCREEGARSVHSAVLVEKLRSRACTYRPDFVGLTVPDRYVFGAGMDYREYLRNLPGIYAVAAADL
jgi:hypoxanthine phosphoribosyltransferase